jgi:hypothetical protein
MIDVAELEEMRGRYDAASRALDAMLLRRDGRYADLPREDPVIALLEAAAKSAGDVPALVDECVRLAPASYVYGTEECMERGCDYFADGDGNPVHQNEDWCPHVVEKVATLGDVKLARAMARVVLVLRERLVVRSEPFARELFELIDDTLGGIRADDDIAEVVAAAGLVGAGLPGTPHVGGQK